MKNMIHLGFAAREASKQISRASTELKNSSLLRMADLLAGPLGDPEEARSVLVEAREAAGQDPLWRDEIDRWLGELERGSRGRHTKQVPS